VLINLIALIFSLNLMATSWDLQEISHSYDLEQSIVLKQLEKSGSFIHLMADDKFVLEEIIALDMIRVTLFRYKYLKCPGKDLKTEMEIIAVKEASPLVEVGVQLETDCFLEVFIENKDLRADSIFK
jgi:hypothetical protein